MNFELPDNHPFLKNPTRAQDFLAWIAELYGDLPEADYRAVKDIVLELKRLPPPFVFNLKSACEEAAKWQKYFPGLDIPKIVAALGSRLRDNAQVRGMYGFYGIIFNDLLKAEKNLDYPRGYRPLRQGIVKETAPAPDVAPVYDDAHPPGWQMRNLFNLIADQVDLNMTGENGLSGAELAARKEQQRRRLQETEI